jgi:hypothetical protein
MHGLISVGLLAFQLNREEYLLCWISNDDIQKSVNPPSLQRAMSTPNWVNQNVDEGNKCICL